MSAIEMYNQSLTPNKRTSATVGQSPSRQHVLVTGAAGTVGQLVTSGLAETYDLMLTDIRPLPKPSNLPFFQADITDLNAIRPLFQDIDIVLHLAVANWQEPWEALLQSNIIGAYNVFLAAQEASCRRVVYTSSIQVVDAPDELLLSSDARVQPSTLYGTTKAWGESLGSFFAHKYGYSVICLRLGWVVRRDNHCLWPGNPSLPRAITDEDLISLVEKAMDAPTDLNFVILNGLSDNRQKRLDISDTRRLLGYTPQDDVFRLAESNQRSFIRRVVRRLRRGRRLASQMMKKLSFANAPSPGENRV